MHLVLRRAREGDREIKSLTLLLPLISCWSSQGPSSIGRQRAPVSIGASVWSAFGATGRVVMMQGHDQLAG